MLKVLLFDNDGVLAHTEELLFVLNNKCFEEIGIPYTRKDFENHAFITNLGTTGFMKNIGCSDAQINTFRNNRNLLWQNAVIQTNTVDPEAETVLSNLKTTYRIGIITNINRENFTKTHHSSSVPDLADFVVTREDYNEGKPSPDSYLKGLEMAKCNASEALVIEDSPRGIVAAKTAGIKVVVIPNPVIKNLDVSGADYKISSLSELPHFLETLA
ncbi:MAG: HAD family phosphatase [Candidatus Paceibacterota bacterium]